jgi:hypothetical protein
MPAYIRGIRDMEKGEVLMARSFKAHKHSPEYYE